MAARPVGGPVREGLPQAGEVGDHAVNAGDLEEAEDGSGRHGQPQLAAFRLGTLMRREQDMLPARITEPVRVMSTTSVPPPCLAASTRADRNSGRW